MKNNFKLLTCSGIGDIIYTWYKMQYYYKLGYSFDIYVPDFFPKRGKQLDGMIDGINSINYISINNFDKYKFLDPGSLFEPNSENILDDIVILNINSFIDNGINLNNFIVEAMPNYNFHLNINENYSNLSKEFINFEVNIFLYTSSLSTNLRWKSRPDSLFWFNLVQYVKNHFFKDKQICIHLCGAEYDFELMSFVAKELKFNKIKFYQYVNEDFHFICSII